MRQASAERRIRTREKFGYVVATERLTVFQHEREMFAVLRRCPMERDKNFAKRPRRWQIIFQRRQFDAALFVMRARQRAAQIPDMPIIRHARSLI